VGPDSCSQIDDHGLPSLAGTRRQDRCTPPLMKYPGVAVLRPGETENILRPTTKPFIVEGTPFRELEPDPNDPSIWGRLDANIAQAIKAQRDMVQPPPPSVTTALVICKLRNLLHRDFGRLQRMQEVNGTLSMGSRLEDGALVIGKHR
jgi:hypothetical protein